MCCFIVSCKILWIRSPPLSLVYSSCTGCSCTWTLPRSFMTLSPSFQTCSYLPCSHVHLVVARWWCPVPSVFLFLCRPCKRRVYPSKSWSWIVRDRVFVFLPFPACFFYLLPSACACYGLVRLPFTVFVFVIILSISILDASKTQERYDPWVRPTAHIAPPCTGKNSQIHRRCNTKTDTHTNRERTCILYLWRTVMIYMVRRTWYERWLLDTVYWSCESTFYWFQPFQDCWLLLLSCCFRV